MSRMTTNNINNLFMLFDVNPRLPDPQTYKEDTYRLPIDLGTRPGSLMDPLTEASTYSNEIWHKRRLIDPKSRKTHWFWVKEE